METLTHGIAELSKHALLMYRTMLIKAELRRRRAVIQNAQDRHSILIPDNVLPTSAPPGSSIMYNCNRSEIKRVFNLFDENKDGLISADELQLHMRKLGFDLSEQTVRGIVGSVDRNSDDLVDFDEFYSLYSSVSNVSREKCCSSHDSPIAIEKDLDEEEEEEALIKAFFVFDENRDGCITASELQQVLLKLGIPEGRSLYCCTKMIETVDADGNGSVDFFEFQDMMSSSVFSCGSSIPPSSIHFDFGNRASNRDQFSKEE